jgi:hypothetical protein
LAPTSLRQRGSHRYTTFITENWPRDATTSLTQDATDTQTLFEKLLRKASGKPRPTHSPTSVLWSFYDICDVPFHTARQVAIRIWCYFLFKRGFICNFIR